MLDGKISDVDLEKKNHMISLLSQRRNTYGSVAVKSVLMRTQTEWKNSFTIFQVLHKSEKTIREETHRYPNSIVARRTLTLEELIRLIEDLVTKGKLKIDGVIEGPFEGYFSQVNWYDFAQSGDEVFKSEWPANSYVFESRNKSGLPSDPFVALDAPLFAGVWELLRVWTDIDVSRYSQLVNSVVFLVPNYEAKIERLHLNPGYLDVAIRTLEGSAAKIVGKLYCEKSGSRVLQKDVPFERNEARVSIDFVPDMWQFYLLSKDSGEIIDLRKVYASWQSLPSGVTVEIGSADIEEILRRGENEQVEFKQEIVKKPNEFIETVVAFSNANGGSIFVGVDNNGKVLGAYDGRQDDRQEIEQRLQDQLRNTCEPMPQVNIQVKEFEEKTIYIVRVERGKDKPYNYKDRGVFVRAGSTDRLASRIELDRFYQERQSSVPFGRGSY